MIQITKEYLINEIKHSTTCSQFHALCWLNVDYEYLQTQFPHFTSCYRIKISSDVNRKGRLVGVLGLLQSVGVNHAERMMRKAITSIFDKTCVCIRNSRYHVKVTFYNI